MRFWEGAVARTGESPWWDEAGRRILWVDIRGEAVLESGWDTGVTRARPLDGLPAFVAPRISGDLLVATTLGLENLSPDGVRSFIGRPADMTEEFRFNDGTVDPAGRLIIGTLSLDRERQPLNGSLYAFDPAGGWRRLLTGIGVVNGLAFSPDGATLYVSDSHPQRRDIACYRYDLQAPALSDERRLVSFIDKGWPGVPDGAAMDRDGGYWIAAHGAGAILRLTPDGEIGARFDMPFPGVSKPAFVGPDRDTMAVTSFARADGGEADRSGMLLGFNPGVSGPRLPALNF